MSSTTEMFPTVSGDVELPKTFINSLRILFDILDEDKDGYVPVAEIEKRWQGDGISGLPNGVLQSLRKVAPANGSLNFDLFCSALKLTLKTNKERSRSKEHRQPNKAAVRPNNVHPLRSHQSAPHLRVNSVSTDIINDIDTAEDHLKPKLKSTPGHLRSQSVSATADGIGEDSDLKVPPQHRGHLFSPSNDLERDRSKLNVRVMSPHNRQENSSDLGSRVKPRRISSPDPRDAHVNHISSTASKELTMKDRMNSHSSNKPVSPTPVKIYPTTVEAKSPPPGGQTSPRNQSVGRVTSPRPTSNYSRKSYPPSYTYPHRRPTHSDNYSNSTSNRSLSSAGYEEHLKTSSNYATVTARPMVRSPKPGTYNERTVSPSGTKIRPSSSSSSATSPKENQHHQFKTTLVKSPPPYMAHVKPQSHKVVKAQLVYPQSNTNQNRSTSAPPPKELSNPPKKANRRKKEEPRRHTLSNGITTDFNALKRMKDLEQERDVLHQGLDLLEKCQKWYQEELMGIKEQQHQLITGKEISRSSHQDRVVYRTTRIMDINRQMRALMNSPEAFPDHMNLAMPERSALPVEKSPLVSRLKDQNRKLTQEVSFQGERITSLEKEKSALIRQLFEVRGRPRSKERSRERPENTTLL